MVYNKTYQIHQLYSVEYDRIKMGLCYIHSIPRSGYDNLDIGYYTQLKSGKPSAKGILRGMLVKYPDGTQDLLAWDYVKDVVIPECRHWWSQETNIISQL